jgi:hypothetical protein
MPPPPTGTNTVPTSRALLEDLEAHRALADDDLLVIERRHDRQAARRGFLLRPLLAIERRRPFHDHFGAVALAAVDLHLRRGGRHHDHGRRAKLLRRHRDGLAVIARGIGDHAAREAVFRQLRNHVERAAILNAPIG